MRAHGAACCARTFPPPTAQFPMNAERKLVQAPTHPGYTGSIFLVLLSSWLFLSPGFSFQAKGGNISLTAQEESNHFTNKGDPYHTYITVNWPRKPSHTASSGLASRITNFLPSRDNPPLETKLWPGWAAAPRPGNIGVSRDEDAVKDDVSQMAPKYPLRNYPLL